MFQGKLSEKLFWLHPFISFYENYSLFILIDNSKGRPSIKYLIHVCFFNLIKKNNFSTYQVLYQMYRVIQLISWILKSQLETWDKMFFPLNQQAEKLKICEMKDEGVLLSD